MGRLKFPTIFSTSNHQPKLPFANPNKENLVNKPKTQENGLANPVFRLLRLLMPGSMPQIIVRFVVFVLLNSL